VESMLSRLRPRYQKESREFERAIEKHPALGRIAETGVLVPSEVPEQRRTLQALCKA
jgi:hypothetical protein